MAVDSQDKRSSATGIALPFMVLHPQPDGSDADTEAQRAGMSWSYSGIAFSPPPSFVISWARHTTHVSGVGALAGVPS